MCLLYDGQRRGRDAFVLLSDHHRRMLAAVLDEQLMRNELATYKGLRRRWTDSTLARVAAIVGIIALLGDFALQMYSLVTRAH